MRRWLLLLVLVPAAAQEPRQDRTLLVTLSDGSRFSVATPDAVIVLDTPYGEQRIPFKHVQSARRIDDREFAVKTARISIQGELATGEFEFDAGFGRLRVPAADVTSINLGAHPSLLADDETAALWVFEDPRGRGQVPPDFAKGRMLDLHEMEVARDGDGTWALSRKQPGGAWAESPADGLNFPSGEFTLEARVKLAPANNEYVLIAAKIDKSNNRNYALFGVSNGQVYWDANSPLGSYSFVTPSPEANWKKWTYLALVVQTKAQTGTLYVDGKLVLLSRQNFRISADEGGRFVLGGGSTGHGTPEKIQFVRVSKVARTAEEIAECQRSFDTGSGVSWRGTGRGLSLRDGGYLKGEFPKLAGATFRTKFGALKIAGKSAGQIAIYPYREHELGRLREEVKALIEDLGVTKIERRDEAQLKLLKIGAPAVELLREQRSSSDEEVRTRIDAILKKLEATGATKQPIGDVLLMGRTALQGWLELDKVELATKYGRFDIPLAAIRSLNMGEAKPDDSHVIRLRSGETIEGRPPRNFVVEVESEFGPLKVPLKEITRFSYDEISGYWTVKTDRMTAVGKVSGEKIELETPAGAISIPLDQVAGFGVE